MPKIAFINLVGNTYLYKRDGGVSLHNALKKAGS